MCLCAVDVFLLFRFEGRGILRAFLELLVSGKIRSATLKASLDWLNN